MAAIELKETPLYNDSSLIGLWRLEGNGNDEKNTNNFTSTGVTYGTGYGVFGQGGSFDGTVNSYLIKTSFSGFPTTQFTISFWIKMSDDNCGVISYASSTSDNETLLYHTSGQFNIYVKGAILATGVKFNDNVWTHCIFTWDSTTGLGKVYKNGILAYSGVLATGLSITGGGALVIGQEQDSVGGGFDGAQAMSGYIDDLALFNRVLSPKEIKDLYDGTYSKYVKNTLSKYRKDRFVGYIEKNKRIENTPLFNDTNLIGYWKLDGNSFDSKASNNGTDTNVIYPEENSHFGKPAKFNGSTSHIQVTNINHQANNFTYSWWTKWDKTPISLQTYVENGTWGNSLIIRQENYNALNIYAMSVGYGAFNFAPIVDKWHHLCLIRNGTTLYLYTDGQLAGTLAFDVTITPSVNMWFGASQHLSTQCLTGYMTDVAIFSRALTEAEVRQICFGFKEQNNLQDYKRLENNEVNPEIEEGELMSPLDIASCKLWIDISKLPTAADGTAIASAPDLSGNGNNLAQISAGQNPKYYSNVLNGLATMRGTAAASTTFSIPFTYTSPTSIFYIARKTSTGGRVLAGRTNNWLMGYWSNYKQQAYYEGWIDANSDVANETAFHVWTGISNTTSYLMEDGKVVKYGTGGTTSPAGLTIGFTGTSEFSDFDIGEIIGYNRDLNSRERELVSNYLLKKWGMEYNLALMKPVTTSWVSTNPWNVTDGSTWTDSWVGVSGSAYVLVDLLKVYNVSRVDIFHYWWDGRTYYYNKVETSPDGVTWTTRFDSEVNGRYAETYKGKTISFTTTPVRYVKHTLNGSSANVGSHFTEVRVMGK